VPEVLEQAFALDSRIGRTVVPFLFRPGSVTADYLDGKRARYSSPLNIYLLASFVFFLVGSLGPSRRGSIEEVRREAAAEVAGEVEALRREGAAESQVADRIDELRRLPPGEADAAAQVAGGVDALRRRGALGRRVADRLEELRRLPPGEAERRIGSAFATYAPRVVLVLVPVMALFLELLHRRRYFAEHLVFALHAHGLAFFALLPWQVLGVDGLGTAGTAATAVWLFAAMRRVYGEGWARTALKFAALALAYLVALGLGLASLGLAALFWA
jgi:hypothetical protein